MHTKNKIGWSRELWHYWGYVVGLFFMESLYEWCSYIRQPFSFLLPEIWVNQDMVSTRDFQGVKYTQCKLTLKEPSMASPIVGFQGGLVIKKKKSAYQCRRHGFNSWIRKIPWRRKWQLAPVFLPGKSHEQKSLAGYSP